MTVTPKTLRYQYLMTALSPISHHDPAVSDDSNRECQKFYADETNQFDFS
jgi:hypothetical protein